MDEGQLTDGFGNTVDFKNTMIIMTSNIGARFIQKGGAVGFKNPDPKEEFDRMRELVMNEVKTTFTPEFLNRLDEVIVFNMLGDEELVQITHLLVEELNDVLKPRGIKLRLSRQAADWLVSKSCQDRTNGARPLRRAIQGQIEDVLAESLIRGDIKKGIVHVHLKDNNLVLKTDTQPKKVFGENRCEKRVNNKL